MTAPSALLLRKQLAGKNRPGPPSHVSGPAEKFAFPQNGAKTKQTAPVEPYKLVFGVRATRVFFSDVDKRGQTAEMIWRNKCSLFCDTNTTFIRVCAISRFAEDRMIVSVRFYTRLCFGYFDLMNRLFKNAGAFVVYGCFSREATVYWFSPFPSPAP